MIQALSTLHEAAHNWTTEALAEVLGVSRSTLTRRFNVVIGQTLGE